MKKVQLIICLLLILTAIKTVHAKETINWLVVDWSPWMMLQGEHVCNIFAFKTPERETFAYFAEPMRILSKAYYRWT
ncbi:MAG: hypothetical protein GY787_21475 [Alteromonadales bacterium]|nr:hypothetical protein [Alteromonadales bacterium]